MLKALAEWRERRAIITDSAGNARVWVADDGELRDALGPLIPGGISSSCSLDEIAVYVSEWLLCAAEKDGPTRYRDIHPDLRALAYELVPSVIAVDDDDEVGFLLS